MSHRVNAFELTQHRWKQHEIHQQRVELRPPSFRDFECRGYDAPNCVYNCPQGAIVRIDPNEYFDELQRTGPNLAAMAKG